jgi:hypothetical protein
VHYSLYLLHSALVIIHEFKYSFSWCGETCYRFFLSHCWIEQWYREWWPGGGVILCAFTWYSNAVDFAIRFCITFRNFKLKASLRKSDSTTLWTAQLARTQASSIQIVVFCNVIMFWARKRITLRKNKLPSLSRSKLLLSLRWKQQCLPETLVPVSKTTRCYNVEDQIFNCHHN